MHHRHYLGSIIELESHMLANVRSAIGNTIVMEIDDKIGQIPLLQGCNMYHTLGALQSHLVVAKHWRIKSYTTSLRNASTRHRTVFKTLRRLYQLAKTSVGSRCHISLTLEEIGLVTLASLSFECSRQLPKPAVTDSVTIFFLISRRRLATSLACSPDLRRPFVL